MVEQRGKLTPKPESTELFRPIVDLASRELEARNKTTGELAANFQKAFEESEAFSWIGVYMHANTDFGIPAIEVYLAERENPTEAAKERVADVVEVFGDLTLSLRPNLDPHLHLIEEGFIPQLRQELEGGQSDQAHQLVFEEQIPQAA